MQADRNDTDIVRRLDDIWKLGFWDADVAFPVCFALFVGWLSSTKVGFIACVLVGLYLSRLLARAKADKHQSFALHWAWWALPDNPITSLKAAPPSHLRRMVG